MKHQEGNRRILMFHVFMFHSSSLCGLFGQGEASDAAEQGVVFLGVAYGDSDLVGEAWFVEVADEDALGLESEVGVAAAAVGGTGEDEVGLAGEDSPAELGEL